ncbi:hypothetical protein ABZ799_01115 [Nocardiopsis dassonvillei]|uniref:hypothetical protein n=1 Tax=Nocardiopsis dassonvillei TaxID=2014 RepID=UPI0033F00EAD
MDPDPTKKMTIRLMEEGARSFQVRAAKAAEAEDRTERAADKIRALPLLDFVGQTPTYEQLIDRDAGHKASFEQDYARLMERVRKLEAENARLRGDRDA